MSTERGFTLLETLVAFTLLALVMAAAYAAMTSGISAVSRTESTLQAMGHAESAMARLGADITVRAGHIREQNGDWIVEISMTPYGQPTVWSAIGRQPYGITVAVRHAHMKDARAKLTSLRMGAVQ